MCKSAVLHKFDITKQLAAVLQGDVKPSMHSLRSDSTRRTNCGSAKPMSSDHTVLHTRVISTREIPARNCGFGKNIRTPQVQSQGGHTWRRMYFKCGWCVQKVIMVYIRLNTSHHTGETNKHRYVVATQLQSLRGKLRAIPAVPLVHMTRSVMILEPPSDATLRAKSLASASHNPHQLIY